MSKGSDRTGMEHPSSHADQGQRFRARFPEAIELVGGLKKASELANVSDEQVARWRDGKSKPSLFGVAAIFAAAGMSLDEVSGFSSGSQAQYQAGLSDDLTLIPRYDVRLSSGKGALAYGEEIFEHLAFRTSWLRSMNIAPERAALVTNTGDSNEPTIPDGALMLLDLSIREVSDGHFYGLSRDGELLIKRIQRKMDGSVVLKSDNPRYDPEIIPPEKVTDLHVIGRLKWIARSI